MLLRMQETKQNDKCRSTHLVGTTGVNQLHKANSSTGSSTSNQAHLHTTPNTGNDIITAVPLAHNAGLDITKCEQSHTHYADTPVHGRQDLRRDEVGNERDETANEVSKRKCDSRDPGLVAVGCGLAVVESQQELQQSLMRGVQVACDVLYGGVGESVRRESLADHILRFLRVVLDQCLCFADCGFV
jgi:hypothetical protein